MEVLQHEREALSVEPDRGTLQPTYRKKNPRCQPPDFCYQLCTSKGVHNEERFGMNQNYIFALLQIILQDLSVFNVLAVAQELGLTDLQLSCEEHISATLSPGNACAFYSAALQMEQERRQAGMVDGVL